MALVFGLKEVRFGAVAMPKVRLSRSETMAPEACCNV